jgi:hemolysin activation/secretion protein
VGGRQTFGKYPWYAAAFVGGSRNNRGFLENRFAGDRSLYGNFEARLRVVDMMPVIPGRLWLFGLADFGRVWLEGEDSDDWHPSYGGGLAFEVAGSPLAFWTGAAKAPESDGVRFYFLSGFGF